MNRDLRILLIEITQKCNAKCDHCGSRCGINSRELLTKEDILHALEDIREHLGTDVMINITGGEPLMRKDLFEIMTEVTKMGFDWGMVSNGTLINDDVIRKMKASGMKTITVSIDGLKETHEAVRHLPGSYEHIINNLKRLKAADFLEHIQVTFTSNRRNVYEFPRLYEELDKIGLDSIRTSCIDPIGRAEDNRDLLLKPEELQFMIDFVNKVNQERRTPVVWGCCHYLGDRIEGRRFRCFAGIHAASILYNGDIFVCPNVPRHPELIQGNIRTDSFSKVWENGFQFARNRKLDYCRDCRYFKKCRGDSLHTWDFIRQQPRFCYREFFDADSRKYEQYLKEKYQIQQLTVIGPGDDAENIYIEPEAYRDIRTLFHMGMKHPLSMYEQQVGLVGFKCGRDYVVKYVFPSYMKKVNEKISVFTGDTWRHAMQETAVICRNFRVSEDKDDYVGNGLKFLGFAHTHPVQRELCYSVGDVKIHQQMVRKCGDYVGILINPQEQLMGAYCGRKIHQGNLIPIKKSGEAD